MKPFLAVLCITLIQSTTGKIEILVNHVTTQTAKVIKVSPIDEITISIEWNNTRDSTWRKDSIRVVGTKYEPGLQEQVGARGPEYSSPSTTGDKKRQQYIRGIQNGNTIEYTFRVDDMKFAAKDYFYLYIPEKYAGSPGYKKEIKFYITSYGQQPSNGQEQKKAP